jgi:hypothetical protein
MGDHQQGQSGKGDVGAGEKGGQPAQGEEQSFSDQQQDMSGPLLLEEEEKPQADPLFRPAAGMMDGDRFVADLQDVDESLLLTEAPLGKNGESFPGKFPGFFRPGDGYGEVVFQLGGKKTVLFAVVPDKEKIHETRAFYHVSIGRGKKGKDAESMAIL